MIRWLVYWFCRGACAVFFHTYLPLIVKGQDHIPRTGGFILAGNHVSFLDPVAFGIACPRHLGYMARSTLFRNPVFGWLLSNLGVFALKRKTADVGAIKEALRRIKNENGLLLFPEGTRSTPGVVQNAQLGVVFLARKSGAPVIPAYVRGTDKSLPKGARFIKPHKILVSFGKPLFPERYADVSDEEFAKDIMRQIHSLNTFL